MKSFLQRWPGTNFSLQLKHNPQFLLSCNPAGLSFLTVDILRIDKLAEGNGGSGSPWVECRVPVSEVFFKLQFLASNKRASPIASVMEVGLLACTSVLIFSFNQLMKHPNRCWVDNFPTWLGSCSNCTWYSGTKPTFWSLVRSPKWSSNGVGP